jgi:WD40 repeat protein
MRPKQHSDVLCLAISHCRTKVVTAGKCPSVNIWDALTATLLDSFSLDQDSITAVGFSSCGRYVACCDSTRLTVYNVQRKCKVLQQDYKSAVLSLAWSKRPDDLRLALVAPKEISFWHPGDVTKALSVKGQFGTK